MFFDPNGKAEGLAHNPIEGLGRPPSHWLDFQCQPNGHSKPGALQLLQSDCRSAIHDDVRDLGS